MSYKVGFVDNTTATGPDTFGHHNLFHQIRCFATGDATHGPTTQTGTGNGKLGNFRAKSHAVTETWTITCITAAANAGTFSVSGSVSGVLANATVGVAYDNVNVAFLITDGTVDYLVADQFQVTVTANASKIENVQSYFGTGNGVLSGFFAYEAGMTEVWTVTCKTVAANGGVFSVTGKYSGVKADATVGTPYDNGFIKFTIADGSTDFILTDTFTLIPQTWQMLMYNDGDGVQTAVRYMMLKGSGLTGNEEIFIGFRTNHLVSADYYNMSTSTMVGYVPSSAFTAQPEFRETGFAAHNIRLDYWMIGNGQRIAAAIKISSPIYEMFYVGKFIPYASPGQYPYPIVTIGTFTAQTATRFSDTSHYTGLRGGAIEARFIDASTKAPEMAPWCQAGGGPTFRDTNAVWPLNPIILNDTTQGLYGEIDGICQVTGFNNVVENTMLLNGISWIVIQDVYRTGFWDYYALELK